MENFIYKSRYTDDPEDFDWMTGLLNIRAFYEYANLCIERSPEKEYALLRLDIYQFKMVNEFCGRDEADKLICFLAELIKKNTPEEGICSHFRADTFVLCIPYESVEQLTAQVEDMVDEILSYDLPCKLMPAFGICLIKDKKMSADVMCDCANLALMTIKGKVLHYYAFFDYKDRAKLLYEMRVENEMESALKNGEFDVFIQPKVELVTGRVVGGEALVRWFHPKDGLLAPGVFLDIFERNGFIIRLDEFVWEKVFKRLQAWRNAGVDVVPISVNISRMHALNTPFDKTVLRLAERYQVPPEFVILELTESAFLENLNLVLHSMEVLQSHGFLFSMDDYGSGYSSINMLKNIMVDEVKMDQVFLVDEVLSARAKTVYEYSVHMLEKLGAKVVCEGVETAEQAEFLRKCGCITAQGYYFYRPMPIGEFEQLLYGTEILPS